MTFSTTHVSRYTTLGVLFLVKTMGYTVLNNILMKYNEVKSAINNLFRLLTLQRRESPTVE